MLPHLFFVSSNLFNMHGIRASLTCRCLESPSCESHFYDELEQVEWDQA